MGAAPRTRARGERTRTVILSAAEAVFAEKGFAAARLEDVAEQVGIRRASIVYYFRDKGELYDAVLNNVFGDLRDRLRAVLSTSAPLPKRIEEAVSVWVGYVGQRPALARILLREVAEAPSARRVAATRHAGPIIASVEQAIQEGQREGLFPSIDPIHAIFTIGGATVMFVAATPALVPHWPFDPLSRKQLDTHCAEVLRITRRLLGTKGPRLAKGGRRPGGGTNR